MQHQNDPVQRLMQAEKNITWLKNAYDALAQRNAGLEARVKQLEVECGLAVDGGEADEGGIG